MVANRDLEAPLLPGGARDHTTHASHGENAEGVPVLRHQGSSLVEEGGTPLHGDVKLNQATAALAATIIGAGIMALPRAFATLGIVLGIGLLSIVFGLSFFSLSALVRAARVAKEWTYAGLAESQFGRPGATALKIAILLNNSGSMIVYLIIMGDVLCGVAPDYRQAAVPLACLSC